MANVKSFKSLQELVDATPNLTDYFYNDTPGPYSRTRGSVLPQEISNWRDEQRAWRETAVLFDQSHHMPELFLKGRDARALLTKLGVNSMANLAPGVAKQFIACNQNGQMIGECILHDLGGETFELISGKIVQNWVKFHAETGGYDVSATVDEATPDNHTGRRINFRFGMDGPNAAKIFDAVVEGGAPELAFFRTARVRIAGVEVLALRHGMAGHKGVELSGPYDEAAVVRQALVDAGAKHGLRQGGTKAYFTAQYESGWIPYPLPAIYTDESLRKFREWLPADGWEAKFQLAGSFYSKNIADYYVTPFDYGYDRVVKFDHDFIGREALQTMIGKPHRTKVTLVWNKEDVLKIFASQLEPGTPYKFMELPVADYGFPPRDEVRSADGKRLIGLSTLCGYTVNERSILSLAMLNQDEAIMGKEVVVVWGEPDGGSRKPRVERHRQLHVRATVAPAPFARAVQDLKRAAVKV